MWFLVYVCYFYFKVICKLFIYEKGIFEGGKFWEFVLKVGNNSIKEIMKV